MHKVAIIGAGPAGMAAALQLKRYNVHALLLEANCPGGLLNNANKVENYLGFSQNINGCELVENFIKHLDKNKITITNDQVNKIDFDDVFIIYGNKKTYQAKKLIIATGTKPIRPKKMPQAKAFFNVIDLISEKNKHIMIVGAGDAAFDYAINLAKYNRVTILNRGKKIKALPLLQQIVAENSNINYFENTSVNDFSSNYDYLIFAIGRKPNKPKFSEKLNIHELELIKNKKLFLIGDVKNDIYRQTSVAVADGIKAAMEIALGETDENNK